MKNLDFVLRQRIMVVYHDIEWRDEMFDRLLKLYPEDMVTRSIKSRCHCRIELVDGTFIKFAYANDASRGFRADKIIVQPGIEETYVNTVFGRALVRDFGMYVATDEAIIPSGIYYADKDN